jgi:CheY-like chemotaxis protein
VPLTSTDTGSVRPSGSVRVPSTYWPPLYAFLRRNGCTPGEAEDLVQGFFEQFIVGDYLRDVSRDKGRFRSVSNFNQGLLHMKKQILAVDDSKAIRFLLQTVLGKSYQVITVPDGCSAMHWLSKRNFPHLIIADPQLPDLENWELIQQLASSGIYKNIPVMVLSGLSAEETEQKLNELLVLKISGAGPERKYHLDEFPQFIRNASSKLILARFSRDLSVLATRANPICGPMVYEYARIGTLLARGKTNRIAERLTRLRASRKEIAAQVRKINDYMNWFEATKLLGPSGAFADYLKAAELASEPEQRRRDPITVYLDVLETQFQN